MEYLQDKVNLLFFRLLNEDVSIIDFENWVYDNCDYLKEELKFDLYLYLISFDLSKYNALSELRDKIISFNCINNDVFNIRKIKKLLNEIINEKINLVIAMAKLHSLYYETGKNLIPWEFAIYYDSELDDVPLPSCYHLWNKKFLDEKLKKVDLYKDDIINDAKKLLEVLINKEELLLNYNQ